MHYRGCLIGLILASITLPAIASQPQVPTPTGYLGGRVAADETPTAVVVPPPVTPPASPAAAGIPGEADCAVDARVPDIAKLSGPPAAGIASPEETRRGIPTRTPAELPTGEPADDATMRDVVAVVRRLVGCANSQDSRAYEALHSDDYFRRAATIVVRREESDGLFEWLFGVSESTSVSYGFVTFPPDTPMPQVTEVSTLRDGRIGAVVTGPGFSSLFFAFARERPDGPLLVDEAIVIDQQRATPSA